MKRYFSWAMCHRITFIVYVAILIATIEFCHNYIITEMEDDKEHLFNAYPSEGRYFAAGYNLDGIIHYEQDSIPRVEDESERLQMYGDFVTYFKVSGGWHILKIERHGDEIYKYRIYPYAAITDGYYPVDIINDTRKAVIREAGDRYNNDYYENSISSLGERESDFYKFGSIVLSEVPTRMDRISWYNSYYDSGCIGKGFVEKKLVSTYVLVEKKGDILFFQMKCYAVGLLLYVIMIAFINWVIGVCVALKNKITSRSTNVRRRNNALDPNDVEKLYQRLLLEIHPSNYFKPYNPEKVRIANDLLEALQNNRGNRTIIEMIREKAVKSLGIDSLKNDDNLLL